MNCNEGPKIDASRREVLSKTPSLSLRLRFAWARGRTHQTPNKRPIRWVSGGHLLGTGLDIRDRRQVT